MMTKRLKQLLVAGALLLGVVAVPLFPAETAGAINAIGDVCDSATESAVCDNKTETADNFLATLVNTLLFIVGLLAVIVIIFSGIRYVTSAGNATAVASAKNMLIYAIVGLVVAFLAYAIINWVLNIFAPAPPTP